MIFFPLWQHVVFLLLACPFLPKTSPFCNNLTPLLPIFLFLSLFLSRFLPVSSRFFPFLPVSSRFFPFLPFFPVSSFFSYISSPFLFPFQIFPPNDIGLYSTPRGRVFSNIRYTWTYTVEKYLDMLKWTTGGSIIVLLY